MKVVLDVGWRSLHHYDEELCGDRVMLRRDEGTFMGVLADGMGSGVKANIMSTMTGTILSTMLAGGADVETAVDTVVKTLPICSERGISYCTFSVVKVQPDGQAVFVEYDNPVTWFVRGGQSSQLEYKRLIMSDKIIREASEQLIPGDLIVVTSDGAVNAAADNVFSFDWTWESLAKWLEENAPYYTTAQMLAYALTEKINDLYFGQPADDTTAMVIKVMKDSPVSLIFGPAEDKEHDREMVKAFMADPGIKIVCGGTTAQIVGRITGQEVIPLDMDDDGMGVPPISFMDGVDLVTEGVVTMAKALEIVRDYFENGPSMEDFSLLDMENGASFIAKQLIEDCTELKIYLGRALNPAYKDDNKLGVSVKSSIVGELKDILMTNGRYVEIVYY